MLIRHLLATAAVAATLLPSRDVHAHGGIPRAYQILFEPGDPKHMVLRSDLWGFFDSRDGGETWNYICAESWGGISTNLQNRALVLMPGGRFLIALQFDGLKISDDLCTWRTAPGLDGQAVSIVVPGPGDDGSAYVVTANGSPAGVDGQVWRSADRGDTWSRLGSKLPTDFSGGSLAFAPSDPKVAYLAGAVIQSDVARVLRSSDGGITWKQNPLPVQKSGYWDARVVAIDAKRAGVAILRIDGQEGYGENVPDEVWGTSDGGSTWSRLYAGAGDIPGITIDPATGTLFISGPLEGVRAAPLDDALSRGQSAFEQVFDGKTYGLLATDDGLLLGGNNYTPRGVTPFTLGRSVDKGSTFQPLMTMCDVAPTECAPDTLAGKVCPGIWAGNDTSPGFKKEYVDPRCTDGPDGGNALSDPATGSVQARNAGCSCSIGAHSEGPQAPLVVAALAAIVGGLERRTSRRRSRARFQGRRPAGDCTPAIRPAAAAPLPSASDRTGA